MNKIMLLTLSVENNGCLAVKPKAILKLTYAETVRRKATEIQCVNKKKK